MTTLRYSEVRAFGGRGMGRAGVEGMGTHTNERKNGNGNGTGLYAQFVKACKAGTIQPWERDAYAPSARDLAMWKTEEHKDADLSGPGLESEELQAETDNAHREEEVEA